MRELNNNKLLSRRDALLGPNVSTFYKEPLHIVKGKGVWLWDAQGNKYLDCYNNVPHVGHCHPRVVEAIYKQASRLNIHTRYLHEGILNYLDKLLGYFAVPINTGILTCTGSEANDIALRMAQSITGKHGVIATDHTYHGNTTAVSQLSTTNTPVGGTASHVRYVPAPDSYRPLGGETGPAHAHRFAVAVQQEIDSLKASGEGFSALILCPYFANEGFADLHSGFLDETEAIVKKSGGLIIADEVQPGFGRIGSHMWGHQRIGLSPNIVTLGKPMANGHPVAAVLTCSNIMSEFRKNYRYFNTFGGNPVSVAAAMTTIEVLEDEQLMANAKQQGCYALQCLSELANKFECIGDIRGSGLFFGAELVHDRETKQPATEYADLIVNEMKRRGVLLSKLGIYYNTLKIRPPMPFSKDNVDLLMSNLEQVLTDLPLKR